MNNYLLFFILIIIFSIAFSKNCRETIQNFSKKQKNRLCVRNERITSKEECRKALSELGLNTHGWWTGYDSNIPPGCSWTDKVSNVNNSMGFLNFSEGGKRRYDLHPICKIQQQKPVTYMNNMKKINNYLENISLEKKEDVPIVLGVKVKKEKFQNFKERSTRSLSNNLQNLKPRETGQTPISVNFLLNRKREAMTEQINQYAEQAPPEKQPTRALGLANRINNTLLNAHPKQEEADIPTKFEMNITRAVEDFTPSKTPGYNAYSLPQHIREQFISMIPK